MSDNADMKMADYFILPIGPGGTYTRPTDLAHALMHSAAFDQAQVKAVMHAINTYDTLTAENKVLRESLSGLLAAINYQGHDAAGRVDAMEAQARAALKLGEGQ